MRISHFWKLCFEYGIIYITLIACFTLGAYCGLEALTVHMQNELVNSKEMSLNSSITIINAIPTINLIWSCILKIAIYASLYLAVLFSLQFFRRYREKRGK